MEQKWYITFKSANDDWEEFQEMLELIRSNLETNCILAGIDIIDFEEK